MAVNYFSRRYDNFIRLKEIIQILLKYGFDQVISQLNLPRIAKKESLSPEAEKMPFAVRLRLAVEELGPTFVKFGQLLSVRTDILPEDVITELKKLQDSVPAFSSAEASEILKNELGARISEIADISAVPVAAASIAQVHTARLAGGEKVVLKIQRPGIREKVSADIEILMFLAKTLDSQVPAVKLFSLPGLVSEFQKTIEKELDFSCEGRNIERFYRNFTGSETVKVPRVYWDYTTKKILCMELMEGTGLNTVLEGRAPEFDRKRIALNGTNAVLKQVFLDGFFHGDPHPGNIMILPGNIIAFLDFGVTGVIDQGLRDRLIDLLLFIDRDDARAIVRLMRKMELVDEDADTGQLALDIQDFLGTYYGIPLKFLELKEIFSDLTYIIRRHKVKISPEYMLLARTLTTMEGIGRSLYPEFNIFDYLRPVVKKLIKVKYSPRNLYRQGRRFFMDTFGLWNTLPEKADDILTKVQKGKLKIEFEHIGLEAVMKEIEKSANRISYSLIIAGLIVGSSMLVRLYPEHTLFGFPVIGTIGYLIAMVLGLIVLFSIIRSKKY